MRWADYGDADMQQLSHHDAAAQDGFTLIEVVVAVAILAIGIGAGFQAIDSALYQSEAQSKRIFAHNIAMNTAAELRWSGAGTVDERTERIRYAGKDWLVHVDAQPTVAGFVEATISVKSTDASAEDGAVNARLVAYVHP